MVVLAEQRGEELPPERLAAGRRRLHALYGMPMAWTPAPVAAASADACRAVVAAREHAGPAAARCCGACGC